MQATRQTTRRMLLRLAALLPGVLALTLAAAGRQNKPAVRRLRLRKWQCINDECEPYVYDPSVGDVNVVDPNNPIPPGVSFTDLPDDWRCPICRDPKSDFEPLDEWVWVEVPA